MQVIEDNYHELKQLKDRYELVTWLGQKGHSSAEMWKYRADIERQVREIMEGGDD